ncbi:hypothetical protein SAMN05421665_0767 [Yoonia rosea]|uniref:Uncharacterized protein n=1 Tax=Yoonia rosea TaxID=287098 RepID=A0A1R3WJW9_9RHOB|nr:hypothetical protein [Yoonia rosea]SIT78410.1 hypothetical protein SAMN05421665_0767 [Yoonia rosea]
MKWNDVASHWTAFLPRITTRWPDLDENEVIAIDGDQDAFVAYLASFNDQDTVTAKSELDEWLMGEQPADAVMDPTRDNAQISATTENVPAGEDPSDDDRRFGDDLTPQPPIDRAG